MLAGRKSITAKLRIEAPVNGGRNYNGPKVAILIPVKMQVTRNRTERPHGALLQFDIEIRYVM